MHTHYLNQKEKINTTREGAEGKGRIKRKRKICESGGKKREKVFLGCNKKRCDVGEVQRQGESARRARMSGTKRD